jgi:hypothetical protein
MPGSLKSLQASQLSSLQATAITDISGNFRSINKYGKIKIVEVT